MRIVRGDTIFHIVANEPGGKEYIVRQFSPTLEQVKEMGEEHELFFDGWLQDDGTYSLNRPTEPYINTES